MKDECTSLDSKNVTQRSKEWFDAREKLEVTGSEFPVVYGVSAYQSVASLWRKKKGISSPVNTYAQKIMQWGTDNEINALRELELYLDKKIHETGLWIYEKDKKLGASPDGIIYANDDKSEPPIALVECKCPWKKLIYPCVRKSGIIPPDHWVQIQGQLNICKVELAYYMVWTPLKFMIVEIPRNKFFWTFYLLPEISKFRKYVAENKKPPPATKTANINLVNSLQKQENYIIHECNTKNKTME